MKRARISDRTLAAALAAQVFGIAHEHQVLMHEDQMLSLVHRDHFPIPHAEGGSNHFSNVRARLIGEHREKTRTIDIPGIAKRKRVRRAQEEHSARMAAKLFGAPPPSPRKFKRRIASRGFDKGHRPLRSRNTLQRRGT